MIQKKMKIGIFDSGMGGLSVLHSALKMLPGNHFLYYADKEHVPYGEKSVQEIQGFVQEILEFFLEKGVDAIVIACNTATSVATKEYRAQFSVPIIGMEPAIKKAVEHYPKKTDRILVIATPVTIAGNKLHMLVEKVKKDSMIDLVALPELVRFAEKGDFETEQINQYLKKALEDYPAKQYKAVVLGCTHFNYFKNHLRRLCAPETEFMDGNEGTLRQLLRSLGVEETKKGFTEGESRKCSEVEFFLSGIEAKGEEKEMIDQYLKRLDEEL